MSYEKILENELNLNNDPEKTNIAKITVKIIRKPKIIKKYLEYSVH